MWLKPARYALGDPFGGVGKFQRRSAMPQSRSAWRIEKRTGRGPRTRAGQGAAERVRDRRSLVGPHEGHRGSPAHDRLARPSLVKDGSSLWLAGQVPGQALPGQAAWLGGDHVLQIGRVHHRFEQVGQPVVERQRPLGSEREDRFRLDRDLKYGRGNGLQDQSGRSAARPGRRGAAGWRPDAPRART